MIKKILAAALALSLSCILAFTLCACENEQQTGGDAYEFIYNNVAIRPGADFSQIKDKLGEPVGYFEAASCAFDGFDKTYTYAGLAIVVSELDGKDTVFSVTLTDDTLTTPEGITIGSEKKAVVDAYGAGTDNGTSLKYTDEASKTSLVILIRDGYVTSVAYRYLEN